MALIAEAGLDSAEEFYERDGAQVCWEDGALKDCRGEHDELVGPMEKLEGFDGPDMSFAEYLTMRGSKVREAWWSAVDGTWRGLRTLRTIG